MHNPITVKELKEILNQIRDDKEVVIDLAHNYYDIIATHQEGNSLVLNLSLCYNRDIEDDNDKRRY